MLTAKHAIVTPECVTNKGLAGAVDEALERLRAQALESHKGYVGKLSMHFKLELERMSEQEVPPLTGQLDSYSALEDQGQELVRGLRYKYVHVGGESPCGTMTRINSEPIARTFAIDPKYYSATFCMHCNLHLPVGEFVWDGTEELVGS